MGQVSAALAQGSNITFEGKEYVLSPWTYNIQAEFERYLEDYVIQVYKRLAPVMTPDERREELKRIRQEIASGEYTFGSELVAKALTSLPHLKHLLFLMLRAKQPDVTPDLVGRMVDAQHEEVMAKMAEANVDPSNGTTETKNPIPTS